MRHAGLGLVALVVLAAACTAAAPSRRGNASGSGSGSDTESGSDGSSSSGQGGATSTTATATSTTGSTIVGAGAGGPDEPIDFELDCAEAAIGPPALRLLTRGELVNTVTDVFTGIEGQWSESLPSNTVSTAGFDNSAGAVVTTQMAEGILDTAESVADAVVANAATFLPCSTSSADRSCAEEFLGNFGKRLFRRPLSEAEQERYLTFFDSALSQSDFTTALKWMTVGLIQSPSAVYRREIGSDAGDGTRLLDSYELATELAYTFTGSTPSQDLLAAAETGDMGDLQARARELVSSDKGKQALQRFFEGYLGYTRVVSTQRPGIPEFGTVSSDMIEETRTFIDSVVYQSGAGLKELLTATATYPSVALATYYGFSAPASDYAAVERPEGTGVGILAQGSFLATYANSEASSPTRRGLFPFEKLLCQPKPEVPDDVPQLAQAEAGETITTRQRYEELHIQAGSGCASCHTYFDPIGFAFEHFDEGGRYRADENGLTIDASGELIDVANGGSVPFDGQEGLVAALVDQPVTYECFSAFLATYAYGSSLSCLGPSQAADLQAGNIGIADAFAALAAEPHFTRRTTAE